MHSEFLRQQNVENFNTQMKQHPAAAAPRKANGVA